MVVYLHGVNRTLGVEMLQQEFEALMADPAKRIAGDIVWGVADSDPGARTFRVSVDAESGYPLFVQGRYNPKRGKLTFTLVCTQEGVGRIYGLDFGQPHVNPDHSTAGDPHKNYWTEGDGDIWAYEPPDISATWDNPVLAWAQFCAEANIRFSGIMRPP